MQPTNQDLLETIAEHTKNDEQFQDETRLVHAAQAEFSAETEGKLAALEAKVDGLATKEDIDKQTGSIKEVVLLSNRIKIGEAAVKYSINKAPDWLAFLTIIFCIFLFFKFGIAGLVAILFGNKL